MKRKSFHNLMKPPLNHISLLYFDYLTEIFAHYTENGWQAPRWLVLWGVRLGYLEENENPCQPLTDQIAWTELIY
jgi:hypothetical protein